MLQALLRDLLLLLSSSQKEKFEYLDRSAMSPAVYWSELGVWPEEGSSGEQKWLL